MKWTSVNPPVFWNEYKLHSARYQKRYRGFHVKFYPLDYAKSHNLIGGVEGRGIGFAETLDNQGRNQMTHSFMNFNGLQQIHAPENKMLVLLLMSWFVADQYVFFFNQIVRSGQYGSVT